MTTSPASSSSPASVGSPTPHASATSPVSVGSPTPHAFAALATRRHRRLVALVLALLAVVLGASALGSSASAAAPASAPAPKTTLEDVESELMCSTCRVPLNQSEAPQANQERETIERLIAEGKSKQQVIDEMVSIYTETVLIDPPDDRVRALRWVLPAVGALLALTLLTVLIRRWRRRGPGTADDPASPTGGPDDPAAVGADQSDAAGDGLSPDERRRLDADLARYG